MGELAPRRWSDAVTEEQLAFDIEGMLHEAAADAAARLHSVRELPADVRLVDALSDQVSTGVINEPLVATRRLAVRVEPA